MLEQKKMLAKIISTLICSVISSQDTEVLYPTVTLNEWVLQQSRNLIRTPKL